MTMSDVWNWITSAVDLRILIPFGIYAVLTMVSRRNRRIQPDNHQHVIDLFESWLDDNNIATAADFANTETFVDNYDHVDLMYDMIEELHDK